MDQPFKPKEPIILEVAATEESPGQSDRPYQRLDEAGLKAVAEAFKASLPDLKLAPTEDSERPYPKLNAEEQERIAKGVAKTLPDLKLACETTSTNAPPRPRSDQSVLDRQNQQFAENLKAAALADKSIS